MSAKTKKTEKGSGVVHFNIHGDYLTNLARERWIEDNSKDAVNGLRIKNRFNVFYTLLAVCNFIPFERGMLVI